MPQQLTESVKDLAKPVVEALGVITERKCSECEGRGWFGAHTYIDKLNRAQCTACSGTGKVRWKWEPQEGEWCIKEGYLYLIGDISWGKLIVMPQTLDMLNPTDVIPILPWEECFAILDKAGAFMVTMEYATGNGARCVLRWNDLTIDMAGKNPTETTYKAIIKLAKELT